MRRVKHIRTGAAKEHTMKRLTLALVLGTTALAIITYAPPAYASVIWGT